MLLTYFADDSLLFFKASADKANVVKDLLGMFQRCIGQLLSPAKCSLLVCDGCAAERVEEVCAILGVQHAEFEAKYLGLPTPYGRMHHGVFQPLEERYVKCMVSWKERETNICAAHFGAGKT